VNLTATVQLAPGARVVPVQLSGPASAPTLKKKVSTDPPETATVETVICAPVAGAVLAKVTVPVPELTPVGKVIVSGFGEIDTVARAATPVPVSETGVVVTVAPV